MSKNTTSDGISAVVLAAGLSTRMGTPKLLLPWGNKTIIEKVITTLLDAGIQDVVVVLGRYKNEISAILKTYPVKCVINPDYENGEMSWSLRCGVQNIDEKSIAFLVVLGDQPQIEKHVIQQMTVCLKKSTAKIIIPSYQMRRGHPWMIRRDLWQDGEIQNMRDFIECNHNNIEYVTVDTANVLKDIDTPSDYDREKPKVD